MAACVHCGRPTTTSCQLCGRPLCNRCAVPRRPGQLVCPDCAGGRLGDEIIPPRDGPGDYEGPRVME